MPRVRCGKYPTTSFCILYMTVSRNSTAVRPRAAGCYASSAKEKLGIVSLRNSRTCHFLRRVPRDWRVGRSRYCQGILGRTTSYPKPAGLQECQASIASRSPFWDDPPKSLPQQKQIRTLPGLATIEPSGTEGVESLPPSHYAVPLSNHHATRKGKSR